MERNEMVRVVVTQRPCLLRGALIERLEKEEWIEVCATASGVDETRLMVDRHRPHVLVVNVSLHCSIGVYSLRKLKREFSGLAVLAFSCDSEFENGYTGRLLRAGANRYVSSEESLDDLIRGIRLVREESPATSWYQGTLKRCETLPELSRQEAEVFCLTGCGYVPKRIAEKMGLSVKTIESYRERIRKKMSLSTGADLLHVSTSFMRSAARAGESDSQTVKELLLATG
ncbi:MAG: response regulator transcription factor [Verrucomicrobiota bacterium]